MTVDTTNTPQSHGILEALGRSLTRLFWRISDNSRGARGVRTARGLLALSDAELAARGLRREQVFYHAFGKHGAL